MLIINGMILKTKYWYYTTARKRMGYQQRKIYRKKKDTVDELELYPTGIPTKKTGKDLVEIRRFIWFWQRRTICWWNI
ncbi:hypothetical protein NWQ33_00615 [Mycoplasmopsis cynos]|nr:hypothetical protein [Mycoplasmopsis cynos]